MNQISEFAKVVKAAWKHRKFVLGCTFIAGLLSLGVSFLLPKEYEASTVFSILSSNSSPSALALLGAQDSVLSMLLSESGASMGGSQTGLSQEILRSRAFVTEVVDQLDLNWTIRQIDKFRKKKLIVTLLDTGPMKLTVLDKDPERAAVMATALVDRFVEEQQDYLQYNSVEGLRFVSTQLEKAEKRLKEAQDALLEVQQNEGVFDSSQQFGEVSRYIGTLEYQRATTSITLESQRTAQIQLRKQVANEPDYKEVQRNLTASPEYQDLNLQLHRLQAELIKARLQYTDEHPVVIALQMQIAEYEKRLNDITAEKVSARVEVENPVRSSLMTQLLSIETSIIGYEEQLKQYDHLIAELRNNAAAFPEKGLTVGRAQMEVEIAKQVYELLVTEKERAQIDSEQNSRVVRVLDPAIVPYKAVRPSKIINTLVGAFLAAIVAICVAYVTEQRESLNSRAHGYSINA